MLSSKIIDNKVQNCRFHAGEQINCIIQIQQNSEVDRWWKEIQ